MYATLARAAVPGTLCKALRTPGRNFGLPAQLTGAQLIIQSREHAQSPVQANER